MATVAALPNTLRDKINSLARKIGLLRLTRSIAATAFVLMVSAGLMWLVDYWLRMPRGVRFAMLASWCALAIVGVVRCLRRLSHKADADALAALIEQEYPNLAERLLTSVELTEAAEKAHGSRTLIDLLVRETEIRAGSLNFLQAAPEKPTLRLGGAVIALAAVILIPAAIWPSSYARQVQRFFLPWRPTVVPYEIATNPTDFAIARGQSLIISASIRATGKAEDLPNSAMLRMSGPDGKSIRLGMKSDQPQVFFIKLNSVNESFRFRVESGDAVSAEYDVIAVDPVQLMADSPSIAITPPSYAQKVVEPKTITGLGDFSALQFGKLAFQFRFTKPARKAILEWTPQSNGDGSGTKAKSVKRELQLMEDGQSARTEWTIVKPGRFNLILEAEHGIRTELPPQSLNVIVDRPPAFVKVSGVTEQLRSVNAVETIPLDFTLADDYGIEKAEIEYRVNEGNTQTEAMNLEGLGTPQVIGAYPLKLVGKVKEGDSFQFRLKIADNRRVPEAKLAPQIVFHPAENRWFTLKIARSAEPLKQQEIIAQRDDIRKRLEALIDDLKGERRRVYKTQQEARNEQKLSAEATFMLKDLRKEHQGNERTLSDLIRDIALTPELKLLANRLQDVGDQEMHSAATSLQQAEKERAAASPRDKELRNADTELGNAIKKLEQLQTENDQIAQQRLDQMKLEQLADKQRQLAEQLAKETDPQKAQEIAREQQRLKDELKQITQESEPLKQAMDAAQAEKNQELADTARELAQAQRDLEQSMKQTNQETNKQALADLAKRQKELAEKAEKLANETQQPSKAAQSRPLDAAKPKEAAEALEHGDPNQALTKQEQTAQDLDRLANEFDRAIQLAKDPREAARQLARVQEDLKNRASNEDRKTPLANMPRERLDDFRKQQESIKQAAETLSVPESNREAQNDKRDAIEHAQKAAEQLANKDQTRADAEMARAKQSLERLADKLPTLAQRLNQAREEVGKLRRLQDEVARQAEQAARLAEQQKPGNSDQAQRDLAQKLADTSLKQADVADRLSKLDVPNLEARRQATQDAANKALQDLFSARRQDIPASQSETKRQLERLEQALNGQKPVDEKAAELAHRQASVANQAARLAANDKPAAEKTRDMQQIQNEQRQIAQDLSALPKTEAAQRQAEALDAVRLADQAAKQNSPEVAKKADDAFKALQRLAEQLQGRESDAAKADRLAKKQKNLADEADKLARKPEPKAQNDLKQQQQRLQDEARQLRGGEEAAKEKQKADDALALLSRTQPEKLSEAQRRAADALSDLADRLGRKSNAQKAAELAQAQRQLANDAGQQAPRNADAAKQQARQAAEKQAELSRQLGKLNAGDHRELAKRTSEQMQDAEKALQQAQNPTQAKDQLDRAAQAAEKLAREMANESNQPLNPQQLAQMQRQLAQQTQQARQQSAQNPQQSNEATKQLARQQADLNRQAQRAPAVGQAQQMQQARQAMSQAERSLDRGDWEKAQQSQQQAAKALEQMAQQQANNQRQSSQPAPNGQQRSASNLPNSNQVDQARRLAQEQRDLRDAVQRAMNQQQTNQNQQDKSNPLGELAKEQQSIAQSAQQLAQQQTQQLGQQARQTQQAQQAAKASQQAANQLQSGATQQAKQSGQQAAQQMQQMAQNGRGDGQQQAQQLARRQEAVNRQLEQLGNDSQAAQAQQRVQQQSLQRQAEQLAQRMQQQANQTRNSPAQQAMQQASQATQQANQSMQQAQRSQQQGNPQGTQQSQQRAAQNLDRASQLAQQAAQAGQNGQGQPQPGQQQQQTGQALRQAQNQMGDAQRQLGQQQQQQARNSMQNAAQSLQQAAQSLAQQQGQQSGQPPRGQTRNGNNDGGAANAAIDLAKYGKDATKFQGKPWGELPGELRTRIIHDMRAQYGDDYGKMIKLYFEQLADKK